MKVKMRDGYLRLDWSDFVMILLLVLIVASLTLIFGGWIAFEAERARGEEFTATVVPISWEYQEPQSGNWGFYVVNPAFLPFAMGFPGICWVEFELEGTAWRERVSTELCATHPATLQATYLKYTGGIDILKVSE